MQNRSISCIVPCYNCQKYIWKTIESLSAQTVIPEEVILINDASTDNTLEILNEAEKKYKSLIKVIDIKENKGASYVRNYGVKKAKGNYILFMDADDIAEPMLVEKYQDKLEKLNDGEDKYILYYSAYVQIDERNNQISDVVRGIQVEPEEVLGYEFVRNYISTSGVLIKKDFLVKSGGFNEELKYSEDWDLWLKLAQLGGFAYVDEPLIRVRRHKNNTSSNVDKMQDAEKAVLRQYNINFIKEAVFNRRLGIEKNIVDYVSILYKLEYWEEGFLELINLLKKGYSFYNLYFYLGLYYLKVKDMDMTLKYFKKTIDLKPDHGAALNNLGVICLFRGRKGLAEKYLKLALTYFPSYMDANHNYKFIGKNDILLNDLKFTWRELRKVLTNYR